MEKPRKVNDNLGVGAGRAAAWAAAPATALLLVAALAAGFHPAASARAAAPMAAPAAAGGRTPTADSLVVLHTNDVHSHLEPFESRRGTRVGGAAARAARIAREKALGGRVLLLDGGDLVQGTPYYNRFHGEPDHKILDLLGYDAIALGNHDLDDGAAAWRDRAAVTRTPILSANVFTVEAGRGRRAAAPADAAPTAGSPVEPELLNGAKWVGGGRVPAKTVADSGFGYLATPYVILERGGLKIAVLGLTTFSLDRIVAPGRNRGVAVGNPVTAARRFVPVLRKKADVVIALTHLGVEEDRRLVERVPGIDLVIGGHSHTPLFGLDRSRRSDPAGGAVTPIAQAGSWGRWLGRTTLRWSHGRPAAASGRLIEVNPAEGEDAKVKALVDSYRARLGADLDRVVARLDERVESADLDEGDHPLGNFVADVMRDATGADFAVMNAGGIRAPLPAGNVTVGDIVTMLPFENRIVVVSMTGTHVRWLLDRIAKRLGKSGFGHVSGLSYVIRGDRSSDVRVWSGSLAEGPRHDRHAGPGEALDENRVYRVATIDFLASGGDYFDELRDPSRTETTGVLLSDAAIAFLGKHPDYRLMKDGRCQWRAGMRVR